MFQMMEAATDHVDEDVVVVVDDDALIGSWKCGTGDGHADDVRRPAEIRQSC